MLLIVLALAAAPPVHGPWEKYQANSAEQAAERLGPGPHTLLVSDGKGITRLGYKTGAACQRARDAVRRQVAPPPDTANRIYGLPTVKAFCVPR